MISIVILILGSYLLGSVNTSHIVCPLMNLPDPRTHGSNNPGATNVLRTGNKAAAVFTVVGDFLKGLIPVLVAFQLTNSQFIIIAAGFASVIGHIFPIYYKFKGGKGVATSLGIIFGINWFVGVMVLLTWCITAFLFRFSALAALISFSCLPIYIYAVTRSPDLTIGFILVGLLIFWTHKSNIKNLREGREEKIK